MKTVYQHNLSREISILPVLTQAAQRHDESEEMLMAKQICCITNSSKQNITDRTYCISYKDISAVIKDTAIIDYYSIPREMFVHHMSLYKTILEDFIKESTVVPVKFGTIARNNEEVEDILIAGYPMFKKAIDAMQGKAQVMITAKWNNLDAVIKRIGARFGQRADIKRFNSSGVIKLGNMSKMAIEEENGKIRQEILEEIKECALNSCINSLTDNRMLTIMNGAFLAQRHSMEMFYERVNYLRFRYGGQINFQITCPLPPYDFSAMEIKRIGLHEIEEAKGIIGINRMPGDIPNEDEIKFAHRTWLKKFGSDKTPNNPIAQELFERRKKAYKTLMDCVQSNACMSKYWDVVVVKAV